MTTYIALPRWSRFKLLFKYFPFQEVPKLSSDNVNNNVSDRICFCILLFFPFGTSCFISFNSLSHSIPAVSPLHFWQLLVSTPDGPPTVLLDQNQPWAWSPEWRPWCWLRTPWCNIHPDEPSNSLNTKKKELFTIFICLFSCTPLYIYFHDKVF